MDAYDRCTNLEKKILPIVLLSMVEAENFSDNPRNTIAFTVTYSEALIYYSYKSRHDEHRGNNLNKRKCYEPYLYI
jgi:hypothetical protein